MALKFLNKKGWHTGSLRNIENVWKAEQKHEAEQKKLEELRTQIQEERERAEFRKLQEQAGFAPRQERLDFLYESGLAVGKASSEGFKALQGPPAAAEASTSSAAAAGGAASSQAAVPGALFEDKPQPANDAWRKLHSDPLLLIRQKEQEALSRIKNNPVKMAMIRKSVEAEKKLKEKKKEKKKEKHKTRDHEKNSRGKIKHNRHSPQSSDEESSRGMFSRRKGHSAEPHAEDKRTKTSSEIYYVSREGKELEYARGQNCQQSKETAKNRDTSPCKQHVSHKDRDRHSFASHKISKEKAPEEDARKQNRSREYHHSEHSRGSGGRHGEQHTSSTRLDPDDRQPSSTRYASGYKRTAPKLSQEEREARLREMQLDAELHEEQRWKRLKKASEHEAQEAAKDKPTGGRNFLDAAQKSIYGTEKGGSSTIEESVRRRTYYLQGGSGDEERNAFRR